jgi:UDP-N-acetylglucosamine--N-acetylmuramyl-(pentapeptide) pyrophosphoryl-undecaprenol N-acetylglucosamine transferase
VVVSAFGSLGARDMNTVMAEVLARAAQSGAWQMIHAAGSRYYETLIGALKERGAADSPNLRVSEYIGDMPRVMAAADVFIGRAGASTLTELMVTGTPAILIPSPNVTGDHQTANAQKLREQCGVEVLPEAGLTPERLYNSLEAWLGDPERLQRTRSALMRAAAPDAAEKIYSLAKKIINHEL